MKQVAQSVSRRMPVLMYHKVTGTAPADFLTIATGALERQFQYLARAGYHAILLSELAAYLRESRPLPPKPVMITFDDGYKDNHTLLYPLLQRYNLKANIFLVAGFIGPAAATSDRPGEQYLHTEDLRNMSPTLVEFGLHTWDHKSYNDLPPEAIDADIKRCLARLDELSIPCQPCLAYTYGAYPKKDKNKQESLFRILQSNGIVAAFRIGNRINKLPLQDPMLIQRIDIRGDEPFWKFRLGLRFGKKVLP